MLKWQRYIVLAVVVCCLSGFVGAKVSDVCESNDDCADKDNERCVQDSDCKKGYCMCKENYWILSTKGVLSCVKFSEKGETCERNKNKCRVGLACNKCPEDSADPKAKFKCLSIPGGTPAVSALNVSLAIAFVVAAVYTAN